MGTIEMGNPRTGSDEGGEAGRTTLFLERGWE